MKLVITTQHRENYGAHDWDGKGECPQYWKFKGGDTYVVRDLSSDQVNKIIEEGIPTLTKLIESKTEAWEEYILGWEIMSDADKECEPWESAIEFQWKGDRWVCLKVTNNDEYGYMRAEILAKSEQWIPLENGNRTQYEVQYKTVKGWCTGEELVHQLEDAA